MNLTDEARKELRDILVRDFGGKAQDLSDSEVDDLGFRLLKLTAIAMKRKTKKEIQAVPEVPTGERLAVQGHWPKLRKARNPQLQLEGEGGRTALPPSGSH